MEQTWCCWLGIGYIGYPSYPNKSHLSGSGGSKDLRLRCAYFWWGTLEIWYPFSIKLQLSYRYFLRKLYPAVVTTLPTRARLPPGELKYFWYITRNDRYEKNRQNVSIIVCLVHTDHSVTIKRNAWQARARYKQSIISRACFILWFKKHQLINKGLLIFSTESLTSSQRSHSIYEDIHCIIRSLRPTKVHYGAL